MTVPDEHTPDELIERATRVMYDGVHDYDRLSDELKDVYRRRARALAEVGLLAEPGLRAELEQARNQFLDHYNATSGHLDRIRQLETALRERTGERERWREEVVRLDREHQDLLRQRDSWWEHVNREKAELIAERDERQARLDAVEKLLKACDTSASWEAMYELVEKASAALQGSPPVPASGEAEEAKPRGEMLMDSRCRHGKQPLWCAICAGVEPERPSSPSDTEEPQ